MTGKAASVLLALTMAIVALFASSLHRSAAARTEKVNLTIGITQFPSTFHPNIDAMLAKSYILAMTQRPFTIYDKDWKLICLLCTELPTFENGKAKEFDAGDGKKGVMVTYTIRPDATWGDGTPVTTDDVVFTWEVGRHPQSGVGNFELYRRIVKVEAHDTKSFTLHVDKLTFEYNAINDFQLLPAHLERRHFADPENYRKRTTYDTDTANPGLAFGPYRIVEVAPGSHVALEPNPTWWGMPPHFKRIVVRVIENTAALEANLISGTIDYIAGELGLTLDQALTFERRQGHRFEIQYKAGLIYEHIDLNLDNPILKDKRVRQALLLALDREAISRELFQGKQPVAHSFVSPLDWIAFDDLSKYPHEPKRAAALLDEAGWSQIKDGFRHNTKGDRLALELMTTAGNRSRETVQQVLQSQWRRLGVDVRLRNEPARVFFGETVRKRQYPSMAMFAWISSPENVPRTTLHSEQIPTAANGFGGQNYTGFKNKEIDDLIERVELELDREKRRALWRRIQEIYIEELPVLPLYYRADAFIVPKLLSGIEPTGHQYSTTYWIENWRFRR
ncbi:MAG TPA: peptide ABC transporter substrate-binding protein [Alphaproteobacteria bacterium]|nr:peptide ABC transporter substrate-binding protein [Alphaproteobacteria bacterium]